VWRQKSKLRLPGMPTTFQLMGLMQMSGRFPRPRSSYRRSGIWQTTAPSRGSEHRMRSWQSAQPGAPSAGSRRPARSTAKHFLLFSFVHPDRARDVSLPSAGRGPVLRPPCMRQRSLPWMAGARQGQPARVGAPYGMAWCERSRRRLAGSGGSSRWAACISRRRRQTPRARSPACRRSAPAGHQAAGTAPPRPAPARSGPGAGTPW